MEPIKISLDGVSDEDKEIYALLGMRLYDMFGQGLPLDVIDGPVYYALAAAREDLYEAHQKENKCISAG